MVAPPSTEPCRICGTAMAQVFTARLRGRHVVRFYACPACQRLAVAGADVRCRQQEAGR